MSKLFFFFFICEKVGRAEWQSMKVGDVRIYTLPDERAKEAARVAAQDVKKNDHYEFQRYFEQDLRQLLGGDFDAVVPNMDTTVAFKRIK